jgi:hypothetical protein
VHVTVQTAVEVEGLVVCTRVFLCKGCDELKPLAQQIDMGGDLKWCLDCGEQGMLFLHDFLEAAGRPPVIHL